MEKAADAFRTISEVAAELDVPQHVLRFWETKFPQVKPLKRAGGRRYYRPQDIELLRAIKTLLYEQGFTIKGVQRILKEQGARAVAGAARDGTLADAASGVAVPTPDPDPEVEARESTTAEEEAVASGPETEEAAVAVPDAALPSPSTDEPGTPSPRPGSLSEADRQKLRGLLAELEHCLDILAAARRA